MESSLLPNNTHPEFYGLKAYAYDWHIVFYSHDSNDFFASQSEAADSLREGVTRDFMVRFQRRLGLRDKQMLFVASCEFGNGGMGHVHALVKHTFFSFLAFCSCAGDWRGKFKG